MKKFKLAERDKVSDTWHKVKDYAEDRLKRYRAELESPETSVDKKQALSIRISELKELLTLEVSAPQFKDASNVR